MVYSGINLTAGSMRLQNFYESDTFRLSVQYNDVVSKVVEIRGVDELYALQYLVNRAVKKLELSDEH